MIFYMQGDASDEEFTDVADSSSSGEEEGHEGTAVHSAADGAALRAAAIAAAATAAAAGCPADDWPALMAAATAHLQAGKVSLGCGQRCDQLRACWQPPNRIGLSATLSQAVGLLANFPNSQFDKAVNELSDALRRSSTAAGTGACPAARQRHQSLLLARSGAYAAMSHQLRSIPAAQVGVTVLGSGQAVRRGKLLSVQLLSVYPQFVAPQPACPPVCPPFHPPTCPPSHCQLQSESRAIFAPDPCQLAALGLKDADAALAMQPDCPEAQLQKGSCLFLLERYEQAAAALRAGLQRQPTHEGLQQRLQEVQTALAGGGSAAVSGGAASAEAPSAGR